MPTIFHIASKQDWESARVLGAWRVSTRGRTLEDEGFIHCSESHQVARIANGIFADEGTPLVVLAIATEQLDADVRNENLDGGTELFPHIYGEVPIGAVTSVTPLQRDSSGRYVFPQEPTA